MILTLDEVKNYLRVDLDDDDALIQSFIVAAEAYLKNATGKEYPETDSAGNTAEYELEKVYLNSPFRLLAAVLPPLLPYSFAFAASCCVKKSSITSAFLSSAVFVIV